MIRFCFGEPENPGSSTWRVIAEKDDVYVGASRSSMGLLKLSLHQSGVWVLAATKQSGDTFESGNRRAKQ